MKLFFRLASALILVSAAQLASLSPRMASASQVTNPEVCTDRTFCEQCAAVGGLCGTLDRQCYCFFTS
jgi:hypothetical protein